MALLDIHSTHLIYSDDAGATSNPKRVYVDWTRHLSSVQVTRPESKSFDLLPGETRTIFSGTRATSIDGTTEFELELNTAFTSVYRMTRTAGTAPAFRTVRSYSPSGVLHTLTVNNNATLEITVPSGNFNAVVGDTVFIPGTATGDTPGEFSELNEGAWVVLSASAMRLTLQRPVGEDFVGVAESVTPAGNTELIIFSSAGVQVGDSMEVSAGFSSVTQQTFIVSAVTPTWVEFTSVDPLPLEEDIIPTATGLVFYTSAKRFIRIEVDQDCVVRFNGDTGNTNRVAARLAGSSTQMGHLEKWGPCWSLTVVNRSATSTLLLNLISAE